MMDAIEKRNFSLHCVALYMAVKALATETGIPLNTLAEHFEALARDIVDARSDADIDEFLDRCRIKDESPDPGPWIIAVDDLSETN